MFKNIFLLFLFVGFGLPVQGQYRAIQSSAGGIASSSSVSLKLTIGEPVQGLSTSSNADTLITGFYLGSTPVFVDVSGPVIFFSDIGGTPISPLSETPPIGFIQSENQNLLISTQITDLGSGVEEALLFYKEGGASAFQAVAMNSIGNTYTGTITAESVNARGLEYYIEARDSLDNLSRNPATGSYDMPIRIEAPGLQDDFPGDSTLAGYRLIAVPMELTNPSSFDVLETLGQYNTTVWRFFALRPDYATRIGNDQYEELDQGTTFTPGSAFWVISRKDWILQTGQATSIPTNEPFTMTLHAGWNFISNPFAFPLSVQNISLSSGITPLLKDFQGEWMDGDSLRVFTGYAIDAGDIGDQVLTIDPTSASIGGKQGSVDHLSALAWSIQIKAKSNIGSDSHNRIGISSEASSGWDLLDRAEPPVIGDYLSVSFPHPDWGKIHTRYEMDVRPPPIKGDTWDLDVISATAQSVQLTFDGIEEVPTHYSIELVDNTNKTSFDLRTSNTYTIHTTGDGIQYPLTVIIGEKAFIEDQNESLDLIPDGYRLDQNYPNPFNPTTAIRYAVPTTAIVTLEVYNPLGQVVATLVNQESRESGYHMANWNARSDDGAPVSSGLYLYRLTITSTSGTHSHPVILTRKMMLVK